MVDNSIENNSVTISGKIFSEPVFSHEVYGEGFYQFNVEVPRLSESYDKMPVTVSERLIPKENLVIGKFIEVEGQYRSYNNFGQEGSKLLLTIFCREIKFIEEQVNNAYKNQIVLNGYLCKKPVYRTTPFGREIADILLAVNRNYNKSDYIPCITWGRNARYSENLKIGDNVSIWGRIQSRDYQKKTENGETINKIAYEVSVSKMEIKSENRENISENIAENITENKENIAKNKIAE